MESLSYLDPLVGACLLSTIHAPVDGITIMVYKSHRLLLKGVILEKCVEMLFNGVGGMRHTRKWVSMANLLLHKRVCCH